MRPTFALLALLALASAAPADEKLNGIACRSVHLGYKADGGTAFYTEVKVEQSSPGTYFCAVGFRSGYFGIQELANKKKVVIFSVWDPASGDDPTKVPVEKRVKATHTGEGVRVKRFGSEGTGGQSFLDFDWKTGETYRFLVTAAADPDDKGRAAFAGYFYLPDKKEWKHLVTFTTPAAKTETGGWYSFVEDFRRNKVSATKVRKAEFGNAWVRNAKGEWKGVSEARFTGDGNPATNIDAGPTKAGDRFFLATGGETTNDTTKLKAAVTVTPPAKAEPPTDLPVK